MNIKLEINVPVNVTKEVILFEIKKQLALELFKSEKFSTGYCAELCDMNYDEFLLFLSKNKISIFSQTVDEVMEDANNA